MFSLVDWASLLALGTVVAVVFIAGIQIGIRYQKLRDRKDGGAE